MTPMIGTGPTVPANIERQYRRRRWIIEKLYSNAANETSERMVTRLARSWGLDRDLPKQCQNRAKIGQK